MVLGGTATGKPGKCPTFMNLLVEEQGEEKTNLHGRTWKLTNIGKTTLVSHR